MKEQKQFLGSPERQAEELARATAIEERIRSKQPAGRRGCPFCGHHDIQAIIRPAVENITQQPMLLTIPNIGFGWPVTLMQCSNCSFIMPFMEDENVLPEGA